MAEIPYDVSEARALALRVRAAAYPHEFENARDTAAKALCSQVVVMLAAVGFESLTGPGGVPLIGPTARALRRVQFFATGDGIRLRVESHGMAGDAVDAAIEFDAATGAWVGLPLEANPAAGAGGLAPERRTAAAEVTEKALKLLGMMD